MLWIVINYVNYSSILFIEINMDLKSNKLFNVKILINYNLLWIEYYITYFVINTRTSHVEKIYC